MKRTHNKIHLLLQYAPLLNCSIALVLMLPILVWFNPIKQKFNIKVNSVENVEKNSQVLFSDLDFDGNSEKIIFKENMQGNGSLKIYRPALLGQFNSKNKHIAYSTLLTEDTNNDHFKEIYFLGTRNDSIFLNQLDYNRPDELKEHLIEVVLPGTDVGANIDNAYDLDGDGYDEIIININAGFALQPRNLYAFNPYNLSLKKSPLSGSIVNGLGIYDIDSDGQPEIIIGTYNTNNYGDRPIPYSDKFCWLLVFNHNLDFKFKPVKITEKKSATSATPFVMNDKGYILFIEDYKSDYHSARCYSIFDQFGVLINRDSIILEEKLTQEFGILVIPPEPGLKHPVRFIDHLGHVYQLSSDFKVNLIKQIPELSYPFLSKQLNITGDHRNEFIFRPNYLNSYLVADHDLKHFAKIQLPTNGTLHELISINNRQGETPELIIQRDVEVFHLLYQQNPLWNIRFIIYFLIYGALFGLITLFQIIQRENIKNQFEIKYQIRELQFKVITAQLNPHFTFNALNSIAHTIYDPEKPEIYDRFTTFSKLIRSLLSDSDKITRTLENEIKLTLDFLEIQRFRFKDSFSYHFEIAKEVNQQTPVPKMIIQLFVENAIKHAFPANIGKDYVKVRIQQQNEVITIEITDNGIGREAAALNQLKTPEPSTGIGLKIMNDYIELLNKGRSRKISIKITDLFTDQTPAGTKVEINIPVETDFQ